MSQLIENKQISIEEILEKLRYQAQTMPVSPTSVRYLRALDSLEASVFSLQSSDCGQAARNTAQSTDPLSTYNLELTTTLTDWLVNQWLMNIPLSTVSLYLDIISSLYGTAVKDGQLPPTKIFTRLRADLKAIGPQGWKKGIDDEIFARALRLTKNVHLLFSDDAIAADLILWSLTHALQPLEEIAMMKRDDLMEGIHSDRQPEGLSAQNPATSGLSSGEVNAMVASEDLRLKTEDLTILSNLSLGDSRRKYVFPLRQSERTPKQLSQYIKKIVNALFKRARLPQATDPFQTVEALWAYAALRTGVPASQVVSYLGHAPLGLPVLKLSVVSYQLSESGQAANTSYCGIAADTEPQAPILRARRVDTPQDTARSTDTIKEYFSAVGKIFLDNPPRWYAMSLRPGVRFTQVCRRIQLLSQPSSSKDSRLKTQDFLSSIQLFYPCEEIARAIGKKIVVKKRPFIHSVVFFRAKLTDIGRLFARIGDLAWCYRQSARPGAPYAEISERQFQLFQQTIAHFTPDFEVASTGELELKKNDRVQIVGGLFAGHEATFDSVMGGGHPDRHAVDLSARDISNGSLARGVAHGTEASSLRPQSEVMGRRFPNRPVQSKGNHSQSEPSEDSRPKTFNDNTARSANTAAKAADTSSVVYRLNIVGDNGIEWRINVDSRLVTESGSVMGSGH